MKKTIMLFWLAGMLLIGIAYAGDSATLNTPSITGSGVDLNVTLSITSDAGNTVSCAFFGSSPSTANSSTSLISNVTNSSSDTGAYVNYTLASSDVLEDSNDYTISVTCYNTSDGFSVTGASSVTVDRSTPSAPTADDSADSEFDAGDSSTITYTVTGTDTTGCTIFFGSAGQSPRFYGSNTYAMAHSGNTCTYDVSELNPADGIYDVYVEASDGTDTATSSMINFYVNSFSDDMSGSEYISEVSKAVVKNKQFKDIGTIVIIVVLLFGGAKMLKNK